jgi:hypothetical protein
MTFQVDLALVGYEPAGSENLSIRLLAAAVDRAGFRARVFPAASVGTAGLALDDALRTRPRALGFSLQDPEHALHNLALAGLARRRGFDGYLVCGGPFATLRGDWVLDRSRAVDGVIHHAGEGPLVDLLGALESGRPIDGIAGLQTRQGGYTPASPSPQIHWRPLRGPRPAVMGVPTADLLAGRGCAERCDYCMHAAVANLAIRECRASGVSREELAASGLGRPVRRPVDDLADEMADLYHRNGVRYFQIIDENPLPSREREALQWIDGFKAALVERGVDSVSLGMMTRGDALTGQVIDALVDLGLVKTLVGIESASRAGLDSLGRDGNPARGMAALEQLASHGVATLFNSLLLHPSSTEETIRRELGFLAGVRGALFETVQARPLPGTTLQRRLQVADRLTGGELMPGYRTPSPVVARFESYMWRMHSLVLGAYTPSFRAVDLLLSAALLRRSSGEAAPTRIEIRIRAVADEINRARVAALEDLLAAAEAGEEADHCLERASARFDALKRRLTVLAADLEGRSAPGSGLARHYRNLAAMAALMFAVAGTPLSCYQASTASGNDSSGDVDSDIDTDVDSDSDSDSDSDTDTEECTDDEYWVEYSALETLIWDNCSFWDLLPEVLVTLDADGVVADVVLPAYEDVDPLPAWVEEMIACYLELLAGEEFPCLAGEEIWITPGVAGDIGE